MEKEQQNGRFTFFRVNSPLIYILFSLTIDDPFKSINNEDFPFFLSKCDRFSPRCLFHYLGVVAEKSRKMKKFDICKNFRYKAPLMLLRLNSTS